MKTVMQEHLEWLKARMTVTPQMEELLLAKEKQQIIEAWIVSDNPLQRIEAEKYYNTTYKQD